MIVCTNLKALIGVQGDAAFVRVLLSKCPVVSDILRVVSEASVVLVALGPTVVSVSPVVLVVLGPTIVPAVAPVAPVAQ